MRNIVERLNPALDEGEMALGAGIVSHPTELFFPKPDAWGAETAAWAAAVTRLP